MSIKRERSLVLKQMTPETIHNAQLAVVHHAQDKVELTMFLSMLGILSEPGEVAFSTLPYMKGYA